MDDSEFTEHRALEVLTRLANGAHPTTGETLPADCVTREAQVARAIALARVALAEHLRRAARRAHAPRNVGAPWTHEEERLMVAAFDSGHSPREIAITLERSLTSIEARLEKLGKLSPAARATRNRFVPTLREKRDRVIL
jgi:hypothetical protein